MAAPSRRATAARSFERQVAVVVAGHRDAHPAALDELVAKLPRQGERQVLFGDFAGNAGRTGIAAAMARRR